MGGTCTKDNMIEEEEVIQRLNNQNKKLKQTALSSRRIKSNFNLDSDDDDDKYTNQKPKKDNIPHREEEPVGDFLEPVLITQNATLYKSMHVPDVDLEDVKMNQLSQQALETLEILGEYNPDPKILLFSNNQNLAKKISQKLYPNENNKEDESPIKIEEEKGKKLEDSEVDPALRKPNTSIEEFQVILLEHGATYQGPTKTFPETFELVPDGYGRLVTEDGSLYEGEFYMGMKQGIGRLIDSGGECYSGFWIEDLAHGKGIYYFSDGSLYVGEFLQGKFGGKGTEVWNDGSQFSGEFKDSLKHGFGMFTWSNDCKYEGNFVGGEIEGNGAYTWADGRSYEGQWKSNKMHGQGKFSWKDGKKYVGEYVDDKKHGYGEFIWDDGKVYKGYWNNGVQHGNGTFIDVQGKEREGVWEDGVNVKWFDEEEKKEVEEKGEEEE